MSLHTIIMVRDIQRIGAAVSRYITDRDGNRVIGACILVPASLGGDLGDTLRRNH